MMLRPRLLPCVMVAASVLLVAKLADLWTDGSAIAVARAQNAQNAPSPPPAAAPTNPPAPPAAAAPADKSANAAAPSPSPADKSAKAAPPAPSPEKAERDPLQMTPQEIDELQQLSQRRVELDKRASDVREREVLMQAAEKRIDEKIAKLQSLQSSIATTVKQQSAEDDGRVKSLAHMYEQMKPQDAARILDQLDVPVVITMLSNIREMKAAPILAAMDPAKAKAVTLALTEVKPQPAANAPAQAAQN